ncbi:MAG: hypothetical protein EOP87_21805 [Verrucomicrobiaceae bacterium]|nr:MAG: hypothetical protein EOP87_21805 [Verrucomicrobiaceae bacterium]
MTHRRLFQLILLASVLALLALGWASRQMMYHAAYLRGAGHPAYYLTLRFATVSFLADEAAPPAAWLNAGSTKISEVTGRTLQKTHGYTGSFRMQKGFSQPSARGNLYYRIVEIPIWVLWLGFVAVVFVSVKLLEKRPSMGGRSVGLSLIEVHVGRTDDMRRKPHRDICGRGCAGLLHRAQAPARGSVRCTGL